MAKISIDPVLVALTVACMVVAVSVWQARTTVLSTPQSQPIVKNITTTLPDEPNIPKPRPYANVIENNQVSLFVNALKVLYGQDFENLTAQTLFIPLDENINLSDRTKLETNDVVSLEQLVSNHLVADPVNEFQFKNNLTLKTLNSKTIRITKRGDSWYVNAAQLLSSDYSATPSSIFFINGVL